MTPGSNRLIVVGASAGGIEAVRILLSQLPEDLRAAVMIVIHVASGSPYHLPEIFQRATPLKVIKSLNDRDPIGPGCVYLARPDHHLLIRKGRVQLSYGPRENRHRPAIDPLFRSAAAECASRVIGIILTGNLGDGAAGLLAIKECGGITIVQKPEDATFPGMPTYALELSQPDHVVPLAEIPALLVRLVNEPPPKSPKTIPIRFKEENAVAGMRVPINEMSRLGKPSQFACPDCHGVLWEISDGGKARFRCRSGHAYSLKSLDASLTESTEEALWIAVRSMEEKISLLERLAMAARRKHLSSSARHFTKRVNELIPAVRILRSLVGKLRENQ